MDTNTTPATTPAPGDSVMVHIPGQKRAHEWIVTGPDTIWPDEAVMAGRPSRQWDDTFITHGRILIEWIVG